MRLVIVQSLEEPPFESWFLARAIRPLETKGFLSSGTCRSRWKMEHLMKDHIVGPNALGIVTATKS